jgi:hypothetical protein
MQTRKALPSYTVKMKKPPEEVRDKTDRYRR